MRRMRPNLYTQLPQFSLAWADGLDRAPHLWNVDFPALTPRNQNGIKQLFCGLSLMKMRPDLLSPVVRERAAPIVDRLHEKLTRQSVDANLGEICEMVLDRYLDDYVRDRRPGAWVGFCIRYPDAEQLESAIELLAPETRYPRSADYPPEAPVPLPDFSRNREQRASKSLIKALWTRGVLRRSLPAHRRSDAVCGNAKSVVLR